MRKAPRGAWGYTLKRCREKENGSVRNVIHGLLYENGQVVACGCY